MGLQSEDYPHCFRTGTISQSNSYEQFQQDFLSSLDARCDLFISNIFNEQALRQDQIDLDNCFIPTYETFTRQQLPHICPLINPQLLFDDELLNRQQKLRFVIEYCLYLGLRRVAIRLNIKQRHSILSSIENIAKYLRKGKIAIIVIIDCSTEEQLSWDSYIELRRCLKGDSSLELCLQIGANLPNKKIVQRWFGQTVEYLSLKQEAFLLNNKGYPVLSTAHQLVVKDFMKRHVNLLLSHHKLLSLPLKQPYFKYLGFVLQKVVQSMTKRDIGAQRLLDYLQAPLQPYIDNLDGETYDIFESDPHKYDQYEIALTQALKAFPEDRPCITYYVGAGKGLILTSLMKATKKAGKKVKVYCIQKNPFPIQTIKRRINKNKWGKFVQVVQADIKDYVMPEKPDLIFSELLGGFGDNELSPECVRWAQKNATEKTVFVPQKYTSYIRPVSCNKLHQQLSKKEKESYFTVKFGLHYSPFDSKPIWFFEHPLHKDDNLERSVKLEWQANEKIAVHGFQGSFDCNLFGNAFFTIVPEMNKIDSYSWFPLFFSFKEEELVQAGEKITIEMERKSTENRVWYQWRYQIESLEGNVRNESGWHNEKAETAIYLAE